MTTEKKYLMRPELCSKRGFQEHVCRKLQMKRHKQGYVALLFKNKQLLLKCVHECLQPIVAPNQYYF
jgi:hypothetical protein